MRRMYSSWLAFHLFSLSATFTNAELKTPDYNTCKEACNNLSNLLPRSIVTNVNDPAYASRSQLLYWAQQQSALKPSCYVHVRSALDISTVLSVSRSAQCPFAVRGGGHSDVAGASNSPGGITLDLTGLNGIEITDGGKVTRVGAGLKWGDVYGVLEGKNLSVVGGRLSGVGVAGLTLGGGISYYSGLHGFACDNVKNFEVVLANGSIVDVSFDSQYSDLYRALRGGGNNFGVVSRFDLDTYPQRPMWGGLHVWSYNPEVTSSITSAFTNFSNTAPSDPNASIFIGLGYSKGTYNYAAGLQYALPAVLPPIVGDFSMNSEITNSAASFDPNSSDFMGLGYNNENCNHTGEFQDDFSTVFPPIFNDFTTDLALTTSKIFSTARITSLSDLTDELDKMEPPGIRSRFTTATFRADTELQRTIHAIFVEEVSRVVETGLQETEGFAPMAGFQPLTSNLLLHGKKRGGNVLGLDPEDAPLMVCSFGWEWSSEADDALVISGIQNVHRRSVTAAKEMGLYNDYIYMNYAAPEQSPIESYGARNQEFLKSVQRKYDPEDVFTRLLPGGFKVR